MQILVQLSDCHMVVNGQFRGVDSCARLEAVISQLPADMDGIVITGDIANDGDQSAYQVFKEMMRPINQPIMAMVGNHDCEEVMKTVLSEYMCDTLDLSPWQVLRVNSVKNGAVSGWLSDDEKTRVKRVLAKKHDTFSLLALHHPPLSMQSDWNDKLSLENGQELLRLAQSSKAVRGVIWGHAHQANTFFQAGLNLYAAPSTALGYGADKRFGYRKIMLYDDGTMNTEVVWMN